MLLYRDIKSAFITIAFHFIQIHESIFSHMSWAIGSVFFYKYKSMVGLLWPLTYLFDILFEFCMDFLPATRQIYA